MTIERASLGWRPYALLALLCLGLYLPGLAALPVMDRDEARFAQATRQMLESHDFLTIHFQDEARNKKPAGIYWLQAASVAALSTPESTTIWPYRLPSLLGATAATLLTFAFGARLVGRGAALVGAALLASSLGLTIEAHLAKTDAVLLATIVAAQGALGEIYRQARRDGARAPWGWALLFWAAEGVSILVKGPVAPLLALLTAASLSIADRDARWLRGLRAQWGALVLVAIAAPWLVAVNLATHGAFLGEAAGHDFLGKLAGAQESHGAPPGYYLLLLPLMFWPGSLFLGPGFAWAWKQRHAAAERFLIAWGVPFWVAVELVPTKLPHYLLPAYPALALVAGAALVALGEGQVFRRRWLDVVVAVLWTVAGLLIAMTLVFAPAQLGEGFSAAGIVAAAVILIFGGRMLRHARRYASPGLGARAALLALLVLPLAFELVAPRLDRLWLSRSAAALVARAHLPPGTPVSVAGYAEPSLVFLLGTKTRLVAPDAAAAEIAARPGAVALVERRDDAAFRDALEKRGFKPRLMGQTAGLDYSNGHPMMLMLYGGARQ